MKHERGSLTTREGVVARLSSTQPERIHAERRKRSAEEGAHVKLYNFAVKL